MGSEDAFQPGDHAGGGFGSRGTVAADGIGGEILLIGALMLVLIVELLNSAIEAAVDRDSLEINPLGKRGKIRQRGGDDGADAAGGTWVAIIGSYFFRA